MSRTKKYNKKSRTKKNNKKYRNFRKKTLSGGMDCNYKDGNYKDCSYFKKLKENTRKNIASVPGKNKLNRHETSIPHEKDDQILYTTKNVYTGDFVKGKSRLNRPETSIQHENYRTILYANGDVYTGDFVKGKREGTGKLIIKEGGPTYEGEGKDDKFVALTDWKNANKKKSNSVL